jgi:5-methyltetrahydrofolate--homocysteine methyltransferase
MVHVASEMKRLGFEVPLLIGGATTSSKHTAVRIAPAYGQGAVHVTDASRAVGIVGEILRRETKDAFLERIGNEQASVREAFEESRRELLPLSEAREKRLAVEWSASDIAKPEFLGTRVLDDVPLAEIVPYIDWTPFFHAWELRGIYPAILDRPDVGTEARDLFEKGQKLLDEIVKGRLLRAKAVYGFFAANADGDDIVLFDDHRRTHELARFHALRQQQAKSSDKPHLALADFLAPRESGIGDYLGLFAVTAGHGTDELVRRFEKDHDDYHAIMTKALADRLAEALAEMIHEQARKDCSFGKEENLSKDDLIRERYRGIRPAPGYPACPDHSEKAILFELLNAEEKAGLSLTETFAMSPPASVSGLYFNHLEARYFAVGKIGEDQVEDYARRKGIAKTKAERWLRPNLGYEPNNTARRRRIR